MSPSPVISDRLARQLSGRCCYGQCLEDATDASDYCAPHHEATKARGRRWVANRRKALREKRRCIGCRRRSKKLRCPTCYKRWKEGRVDNPRGRVDNAPAARGRVVHEDRSKYGWAPTAHYVGRSRRGAPSVADRAQDGLIDIGEARRLFEAFAASYQTALSGGVFGLGKVEREKALRLVAEVGARASRQLSAVVLALDPEAEVVAAEDDK
jgi:hypothetical protein